MSRGRLDMLDRVKKYVLVGAFIGLAVGVLEAFLTSLTAPDLLKRMGLHFAQFGYACPFFGAALGYVIAKRIERRAQKRVEAGCCGHCGYDLTGNVSGVCPECGEEVPWKQ